MARDQATTADKELALDAGAAAPRRSLMSRLRWPLMIGGPIVLLAIVAYFVLTSGRSQSTDDAYVQAARIPVSASIGGRVTELDVRENQFVTKGTVLFRLDVRDFAASQEQAEAQVAGARLQVQALEAAYRQQSAAVKTAQTSAAFADREAARQKSLMQVGVASRDQYETAQHNAEVAHQNVTTAQQALAQALANLGGLGVAADRHPQVAQAIAAADRARLNVSYGTVVAPQDGVVTRVEQLQVGSYVNPAQTLFWLVAGTPWVEANFKEDQLAKMQVGQPAKIHVDACAGGDFDGYVASFSPGAGQAFSPLPAQNATGNWVKVVQRLPVRIAFSRPPPAKCGAAGLSANVTVDVRPGTNSGTKAGTNAGANGRVAAQP
ncbi:MAG TPA: HlyD family secretion protein [Caulobacteraceae bacterium]|nr:HlyD family secretion protein [Caulobacteraceae bacterium]